MTKREICERLIAIHNRLFHEYAMADGIEDIDLESIGKDIGSLILDIGTPDDLFADSGKMVGKAREEEAPEPEPKSKFPIGHPLHMSTEEMKAADTALFTQTGGRMGKDWRNADEPPVLIYEENGHAWEVCPACGGGAFPILNKPWTYLCKRCTKTFTRNEEA